MCLASMHCRCQCLSPLLLGSGHPEVLSEWFGPPARGDHGVPQPSILGAWGVGGRTEGPPAAGKHGGGQPFTFLQPLSHWRGWGLPQQCLAVAPPTIALRGG